jgi:adenylylsulfate kinase
MEHDSTDIDAASGTGDIPVRIGPVVWLYGLSGAGKTTLAESLARHLALEAIPAQILDGDTLRRGLCRDLGYDEASRRENIRRAAEVAKLFAESGRVVLAAFVCPLRQMREAARSIVGAEHFMEVYVRASYETCARRDVKGLYASAEKGTILHFTGRDDAFEEPLPGSEALVVNTERHGIARCTEEILAALLPRIRAEE